MDIRRGWEGPRDGCRGALKEERGWEGISRWGRSLRKRMIRL